MRTSWPGPESFLLASPAFGPAAALAAGRQVTQQLGQGGAPTSGESSWVSAPIVVQDPQGGAHKLVAHSCQSMESLLSNTTVVSILDSEHRHESLPHLPSQQSL